MNKKDWNEGLNNIDPALVEEHIEEMAKSEAKSCKKPIMWTKYISVAAAVCLVFGVLAVSLILNRSDDEPITIPETEVTSEDVSESEIEETTAEEISETDEVTESDVSTNIEETTQVSEETSKEDITTNKTEEDSDKEYSNPDDRYFYRFDSYEQLIDALNDIENSSLRDNIEKYGQYYPRVLDAFEKKSISPLIPCYQDSPFELRVKKGYPSLTFMTLDYYDIPWIWYHCLFEKENLRVQICYLDVLEIPEINSEHTYLDVRYILKPTYPTPDNYTENSDCKNVYEKQITVCGRTVTALINEKVNGYAEIGFRMDGMLVIIHGKIDMLTDEFLSSFDLKTA